MSLNLLQRKAGIVKLCTCRFPNEFTAEPLAFNRR